MSRFSAAGLSVFVVPLAFAAASPIPAQAVTVDLDFGSFSQPTFGTGTDLEMRINDAAVGINATLTAASAFVSNQPNGNGAVSGDLRVNLQRGNSVELTLALWDATVGAGYEAAYDPSEFFSWDLVFYDLDGVVGNTTDNITLLSPSSYTVTTTTNLTIDTSVDGQVTFIGGGANDVPGDLGLSGFTQAQADVAVSVQVSNLSYLTFVYEATGSQNTGRNAFIDGGFLTLKDFETVTGSVASVPLPASALLLLGGFVALGGAMRLGGKRAV